MSRACVVAEIVDVLRTDPDDDFLAPRVRGAPDSGALKKPASATVPPFCEIFPSKKFIDGDR